MVGLDETKGDNWDEFSKIYEQLSTAASVKPIGVLLDRANALSPFAEASGILDNGCGPGPIMNRILADYKIPDSCSLTCSDFSEGMISQVQQKKDAATKEDRNAPWSRVETVVQNAMDLQSVSDGSKSHVTAGFVYFMVPDPQKALSESRRVLKDGGVLSCSSWQGNQWLDLMNLIKRVKPGVGMPAMPKEWESADAMKAELQKAGFKDVEAHEVKTKMMFDDRAKLIEFLTTKMPHMAILVKDMSEDEVQRLKDLAMEESLKMCADEPGTLDGVALVAVGRK